MSLLGTCVGLHTPWPAHFCCAVSVSMTGLTALWMCVRDCVALAPGNNDLYEAYCSWLGTQATLIRLLSVKIRAICTPLYNI